MPIGAALGVAIETVLGTAFENISIGVGDGVAVCAGSMAAVKDKKNPPNDHGE